MYLKSFTLNNFRKFRGKDNRVLFAYRKLKEEDKKINVSTATTLIIGKNNVGKTSIINALEKLEGKGKRFKATDFNYSYLSELLNGYNGAIKQNQDIELPKMIFTLNIKLDDSDDIISNIAPLLLLDNTESATLIIKVELKEAEEFKNKVKELVKKDKETQFKLLLTAIEEVELTKSYYNIEDNQITNFKLEDLLEVKSIEANTINQPDSLTKAFNKIIDFKYKRDQKANKNPDSNIEKAIEEINKNLTEQFQENHTEDVNESLGNIEPTDKLEIKLTADLTHAKLLNNILIYEYVEQGLTIPESQYGLGYTNMVMIIAEIIDYIERSPEDAFSSKLNFISIEEPETYMHPQMQELFIRNINTAIEQLLESKEKYINSQIIITTHSSHILNSKIHSGNSFDYINYCTDNNGKNLIVNLQDDTIVSEKIKIFTNRKETADENANNMAKNLNFIKKHIKYKVSELFFSDAVIFVEGVTEETLVKYWIEQDKDLRLYYISIFNINGAYGHIYDELIKQLKVPTLIITDLDIKVTNNKGDEDIPDEDKFLQIRSSDIKDKVTTNETLKYYHNASVDKLIESGNYERDNLYVAYQNKVMEFIPTSLEEALILTNYKNEILKNALKETKPQLYKKYRDKDDENIKLKSRLFQEKLNQNKAEFSNRLFLSLINEEQGSEHFKKTDYINKGLNWLKNKIKGG